jgi:hypothetical protein
MARYWRIIYLAPLWLRSASERVFSAARRTLIPERNVLGLKIFEACKCLWWWWRNGVVTGRLTAGPMTPRVQIEAQFVTALLGDAALDEEDVE